MCLQNIECYFFVVACICIIHKEDHLIYTLLFIPCCRTEMKTFLWRQSLKTILKEVQAMVWFLLVQVDIVWKVLTVIYTMFYNKTTDKEEILTPLMIRIQKICSIGITVQRNQMFLTSLTINYIFGTKPRNPLCCQIEYHF